MKTIALILSSLSLSAVAGHFEPFLANENFGAPESAITRCMRQVLQMALVGHSDCQDHGEVAWHELDWQENKSERRKLVLYQKLVSPSSPESQPINFVAPLGYVAHPSERPPVKQRFLQELSWQDFGNLRSQLWQEDMSNPIASEKDHNKGKQEDLVVLADRFRYWAQQDGRTYYAEINGRAFFTSAPDLLAKKINGLYCELEQGLKLEDKPEQASRLARLRQMIPQKGNKHFDVQALDALIDVAALKKGQPFPLLRNPKHPGLAVTSAGTSTFDRWSHGLKNFVSFSHERAAFATVLAGDRVYAVSFRTPYTERYWQLNEDLPYIGVHHDENGNLALRLPNFSDSYADAAGKPKSEDLLPFALHDVLLLLYNISDNAHVRFAPWTTWGADKVSRHWVEDDEKSLTPFDRAGPACYVHTQHAKNSARATPSTTSQLKENVAISLFADYNYDTSYDFAF